MQLVDDFLDAPMEGGESQKIPLIFLEEGQPDPRFLRTSYSSDLLLHSCPRKFQLKCLGAEASVHDSSNVTFAFGHIVGDGIQSILIGMEWNKIIMNAFLGWHAGLEESNEKQKKSFFSAIYCLQQFKALRDGGFLDEYEVAYFDGKPASELSFKINFPLGVFRGFVDLVLRHKITGELLVLELKTSSANYVQASNYKNSAQAIGYSVVLDRIEPDATSYGVLYLVYLTKLERFETFEFPKTYHQRALWLRDRIVDQEQVAKFIKEEGNYGIWPLHGESCNSFGRDCEYMDICHLSTEHQMTPLNQKHLLDIDRETGQERTFQFEFELGELLEAQEKRSGGEIRWEIPPPVRTEEIARDILSGSLMKPEVDYSGFPSLDSL
jgi:hypothetical protein